MNKVLFAILVTAMMVNLIGCGGTEGISEGMINGVPVRFTDKDVKAIQGIPSGMANPYANYSVVPGVMPPQSLTIIIGDDYNSKNFSQRVTIFIYDVAYTFDNPVQYVPYSVSATLEFLLDGEIQTYQATSGEVIFNQLGYLNGERIDGDFTLIFSAMGSLIGSFYTRIGLNR